MLQEILKGLHKLNGSTLTMRGQMFVLPLK